MGLLVVVYSILNSIAAFYCGYAVTKLSVQSPATPKRDALEEVGGPSKKLRVWEEHRESAAAPATPQAEPHYSRYLPAILTLYEFIYSHYYSQEPGRYI